MVAPAVPASASRWLPRAKAAVLGGIAATLVAPLLFLGTVLGVGPATQGYGHSLANVLSAAPGIWLFSAAVAVPASLLFGPSLLALSFRLPHPRATAVALGAMLGAALMRLLAFLASTQAPANLPILGFAAALGAVGAGVAALSWRRQLQDGGPGAT